MTTTGRGWPPRADERASRLGECSWQSFPATASASRSPSRRVQVLDAVRARRRHDVLRPRRGALAPHRRGAARQRARGTARARRDPARRGRRPVRPVRRARARAAAASCASNSTTTSTCVRPSSIPGVATPLAGEPAIDFVVVREGTEGPYAGNGGVAAQGHAARDRDRGQRQHRLRRRAGRARRVRARAGASAQAPDAGAQEQRADQRGRPVVPHGAAGREPSSPTSTVAYNHVDAATIYLVTDPGPLRRDRHRQPVRRHHHRPRGRDRRRHRPRRERQPRRQPHEPVHVRAGARLGARHRRAGQGRPDRGRAVGGDAARARRRVTTPRARVEAAVAADLASRDPKQPGTTSEIGERLAKAAAG